MKIREALLKGADHIEKNPEQFRFMATEVPGCKKGGIGCALGWAGHFMDMREGESVSNVNREISGSADVSFTRMTEIYGDTSWQNNAKRCAEAMRLYADVMHPAPRPAIPGPTAPPTVHVGIPSSILDIFSVEEQFAREFSKQD